MLALCIFVIVQSQTVDANVGTNQTDQFVEETIQNSDPSAVCKKIFSTSDKSKCVYPIKNCFKCTECTKGQGYWMADTIYNAKKASTTVWVSKTWEVYCQSALALQSLSAALMLLAVLMAIN